MSLKEQEKTNIEVYVGTWQRLQALKTGPGDSFDDVVNRLLDDDESNESSDEEHATDQQSNPDLSPVEEIVEEWAPTHHDTPDEAKREAGQEALELLRERGEANRGLIMDAKGEQLPDPDVTPETFWQSYVTPAYKIGVELGHVELDKNAHPQRYRWVGE